jgi:2-succinyl-6-hydroxy-2,4-cyclohexadiene-1-carboxylate synthase
VPESIVLLHGFAGTRHAWDGVAGRLRAERYKPLALDLPGHGRNADAQRSISFDSCVADVLARAPARFTLCGYSLGGRIALHVALAAPARIQRLVLISTSAGIEDPPQRRARLETDAQLARSLTARPFEQFIARWAQQPLFAADPAAVVKLARADQLRNRPAPLARVLRGVGAGAMEPLWNRLGALSMPATVLVGERDAKYLKLGRRMSALLRGGELVIVSGGHRLLLERPDAVARVLEGLDAQTGPDGQRDRTVAHRELVLDVREQAQRGQAAAGQGAMRGDRRGRV